MGVLVVWGICAILSAIVAVRSGRNWLVALVLGLTLGPVGLVLVLVGETTEAKWARHQRRLERFHTDGELPRRGFAMSRQAKLLTALVVLLIIIVSIHFVNDLPRLEAERRQREASPPDPPTPISADERAANRRITECLGTFRGPQQCFEEEQRRGERIEEMAEAIRRSRGR